MLFVKRFIAQRIYRVCTRINYKIVPVTNFNKYLQYGTSETELYIYIYIYIYLGAKSGSEKL